LNPFKDQSERRSSGSTVAAQGGPGRTGTQKPLVRAKERQPAAIQAWLERGYPAIARRAKTVRGVIYWGDETGVPGRPTGWGGQTGLSNQDQIGRSYAPRGKTPVVARLAKRISQGMISAVSNRGLMRFMLCDGALNANRFLAFLRRLIKDAGRKVILIVDNLKVHRAGKVTAWVASHAHEIELFYLPSYAPDHNPSAYLNNDLKQRLRQQPQPGSKDELIRSARSALRATQRSADRIWAYFEPEPVRYVA
jgi:transposase